MKEKLKSFKEKLEKSLQESEENSKKDKNFLLKQIINFLNIFF